MNMISEREFEGHRLLEFLCNCGGGNFFAFSKDVSFSDGGDGDDSLGGHVRSCGHQFAGRNINELYNKRFLCAKLTSNPNSIN